MMEQGGDKCNEYFHVEKMETGGHLCCVESLHPAGQTYLGPRPLPWGGQAFLIRLLLKRYLDGHSPWPLTMSCHQAPWPQLKWTFGNMPFGGCGISAAVCPQKTGDPVKSQQSSILVQALGSSPIRFPQKCSKHRYICFQ